MSDPEYKEFRLSICGLPDTTQPIKISRSNVPDVTFKIGHNNMCREEARVIKLLKGNANEYVLLWHHEQESCLVKRPFQDFCDYDDEWYESNQNFRAHFHRIEEGVVFQMGSVKRTAGEGDDGKDGEGANDRNKAEKLKAVATPDEGKDESRRNRAAEIGTAGDAVKATASFQEEESKPPTANAKKATDSSTQPPKPATTQRTTSISDTPKDDPPRAPTRIPDEILRKSKQDQAVEKARQEMYAARAAKFGQSVSPQRGPETLLTSPQQSSNEWESSGGAESSAWDADTSGGTAQGSGWGSENSWSGRSYGGRVLGTGEVVEARSWRRKTWMRMMCRMMTRVVIKILKRRTRVMRRHRRDKRSMRPIMGMLG
jgi:hypothetical protein